MLVFNDFCLLKAIKRDIILFSFLKLTCSELNLAVIGLFQFRCSDDKIVFCLARSTISYWAVYKYTSHMKIQPQGTFEFVFNDFGMWIYVCLQSALLVLVFRISAQSKYFALLPCMCHIFTFSLLFFCLTLCSNKQQILPLLVI